MKSMALVVVIVVGNDHLGLEPLDTFELFVIVACAYIMFKK